MKLEFLILIGLIFGIVIILALLTPKKSVSYNFTSRKYLLTKAELNFYKNLLTVLPSEYVVMCKVRLADIVSTKETGKAWTSANNKIRSKHIDFVIMNSNTSEIAQCIELNDKSHLLPARADRDFFITSVFQSAAIKITTIPVKNAYTQEELLAVIQQ